MVQNKRDLLMTAIEGREEVVRVPVGFWHHFVLGEDQFKGLEEPEILDRVIKGHLDYYKTVNPDMMKLMNEGFFGYPPIMGNPLQTAEDLLKIKAVGPDHPWIIKQVEHVRKLTELFGPEVMTFYNVFAPLQVIRIRLEFLDMDFERFVYLAEHFPEELKAVGLEIQKDITTLVEKLFEETSLDGIYYCVQNIQSESYDRARYEKIIAPTETEVLQRANELSPYNILHICGYAHHVNDLALYQGYEAAIYNWAVHTEGVSIPEGRHLFPGKCILGGFDNNPGTLIDQGSQQELSTYVEELIKENGWRGFIIGADCSIPNDIDDRQVRHISDASHDFARKER